MSEKTANPRYMFGLALGALGVVYGDIGTSPLYAVRECFSATTGLAVTRPNVLGVLSLIFWSLIILVSIKYLSLVLRADNKGEGGILALLAMAVPDRQTAGAALGKKLLIFVGIFGAALLYGDGVITPAITVLSAVEGLQVATNRFDPYVVLMAILILVALFSVQRAGTHRVGSVFGPIMTLWFAVLAILGISGIIRAPEVLAAVNPWHGLHFLFNSGWTGFVVVGSVFLVMTGAEALYADMGHFGRRPIQWAWFGLVLPSLFLNYLGQGALLLQNPKAVENPFFLLAPAWALYPLVGLSTIAAVIASQALISGAYSLSMQAMQLGYLPRIKIQHTSASERGQIYMPHINWALMLACVGLVLGFRTSSNLAAAYGIAVILTMVITTLLFGYAARHIWKWNLGLTLGVCSIFLTIELAFLGANLLKIMHGGWFPLLLAALIFIVLTSWKKGRALVGARMQESAFPLQLLLDDVATHKTIRVPGTAVFLSGSADRTPLALLHNLKHNRVLHQRVITLTILTTETPHVEAAERLTIEKLPENFYRVIGRYGFMESPDVLALLNACRQQGLETDLNTTTFFLSRESLRPIKTPEMAWWRKNLFVFCARNAQSPTAFFGLPANRVVELGMQVEF
ncbi:MAG: potassium transporter Kup [Verrucomicrobiota bacterium]